MRRPYIGNLITDTPTPLRVLILGDNPNDAELLVRELQRAHFDPDWKLVVTEQDYLVHLDPTLDVILSAYSIPGFSAMRALRLLHERGLEIPFIIVSGMVGEDVAVAAMREGAADYLLKDRLGRLGHAVTRVLEKRQHINERRQIDHQLHRTEKQLANILGFAAESIIAVNEDYQILVFNKAAEKKFGYSAQEALGQSLDLLIPDRLVKVHREHFRNFAALPEMARQIEHRQGFVAKRKDGSEFPVEIGISKLETDNGIIFTAMILDITERKRAEEAIHQNEREMRALVTSLDDIVFVFDEQGTYLNVWSADESMLAQPKAQLLGKRIDEVLGEENGRPFTETIKRVLASGRSEIIEYPLQVAGGQRRFAARISPIVGEDESRKSASMLIRDITERKLMEVALREAHTHNDAILASMADTYILFDRQWRYLYVNEAAVRGIGKPREQILGHTVWELYPDIISTELERQYHRAMDEHVPVAFDFHYLTLDTWWNNRFYPSPNGLAVFTTDITERKRAEEGLRQSERRFRAMIENSADAIALLGADGTIHFESPAATRILGYEIDEMVGRNVFEFLHPDDTTIAANLFGPLLQTSGAIARGEIRYRRKDGSFRWVEATGTNLLEDSSVQGIVVNYRDITERKQAEEKIQQQLQRLTILRNIDQAIAGSMNRRSVLTNVLEQLKAELGVDAAVILLYDPSKQILKYELGLGMQTDALKYTSLRLGDGYAGKAALARQTVFISGLQTRKTDFLRSPTFSLEGFVCYFGVPLIARGEVEGVMEIFHRSPLEPEQEWLDFMETLAGQIAIAIDNATLYEGMQRANIEMATAYDATIEGWSKALDLRDKETEGHTKRVTEMTIRLAHAIGLHEKEILHIQRGALLHDIGKMGVPDSILLKPDKLTEEEWEIMRKHPVFAYELLSPISYLHPALDIPYCHHEKWDGSGYPRGLKGEEIPLAARIFAIVDVWDALTSDRPYRLAWTREKTLSYVKEQSGKYFDPQVVRAFFELVQ